MKTKNAAEAAKEAAETASAKVKKDLTQFDTIVGLSSAISLIDELLLMQRRGGEWIGIPQRYTRLRRILTEVRSANPHLTEEQKSMMQSAISEFASIEEQIDTANQTGVEPENGPQMNRVISEQNERLTEIRVALRLDNNG